VTPPDVPTIPLDAALLQKEIEEQWDSLQTLCELLANHGIEVVLETKRFSPLLEAFLVFEPQ